MSDISFDDLIPQGNGAAPSPASSDSEISFDDLIPAGSPAPGASGAVSQDDVDAAGDSSLLRSLNLYDEVRGAGGYLTGKGYQESRDRAQAAVEEYERQNPVYSKVEEAGAMLITGPGRLATSLAGRAAQSAGVGGLIGGISGFGGGGGETTGEGAVARLKAAGVGAGVGAATGGILGAGTELAARGVGAVAQNVMNRTPRQAAREIGIGDDAARVVRQRFVDEDPAEAIANIRRSGSDAMTVDAGEGTKGLLDTALQMPGPAQTTARNAVNERASRANTQLTKALNSTLGNPRGINEIAQEVASSTAPGRQEAYNAAYNTAIDYSTQQGRRLETVFKTIPSRIMQKAVDQANEMMQIDEIGTRQIIARVGENGKITLQEVPNTVQADYIKRALGELGSDVDQFGRTTAEARPFKKLAQRVRTALSDAVPEYRAALATGMDKIEQDEAVRVGQNLLRPNSSREEISEFTRSATPAQMKRLREAVRSEIDETLAQVQRTITDGSTDAREAMKTIKILSSRANRQKLQAALDDEGSASFLGIELDRAAAALDLKAAVSTNSRTAGRQATKEAISDATAPGVVGEALRGQPINAGRRAVQTVTGTTPDADAARVARIYDDIAKVLTQPRGEEAERAYKVLSDLVSSGQINAERAARISDRLFGVGSRSSLPASGEASERVNRVVGLGGR